MQRPFIKFHDRVINLEAISDLEIAQDGAVNVRMMAPEAVLRLHGEEAQTLLRMLAELWIDSRH
jgi:hypothetical protein